MTVATGAYMKGLFNATIAMGDKVVSSDAQLVIEGFEHTKLLIKQFPWPELSPGGEIEVPMCNGGAYWQPQQIKTHQQGSITFMETTQGHVANFLEEVIKRNGAKFNATAYEGTEENYTRKCPIRQAFVQLDPPDRDMENRSQILLVTGTIFYNYFGNE